jgi:phage-related holin
METALSVVFPLGFCFGEVTSLHSFALVFLIVVNYNNSIIRVNKREAKFNYGDFRR